MTEKARWRVTMDYGVEFHFERVNYDWYMEYGDIRYQIIEDYNSSSIEISSVYLNFSSNNRLQIAI